MSKKHGGASEHLLNIGLLVALIYAVSLRGGPVRMRIDAWRTRARVSRLVETHWETLASTSARMDTAPPDAPMLIEFGDYECPFCRQSHGPLQALMKAHPNAAIAFRHYPLTDIHPKALGAALASICAEAQGRFRQMHSLLLQSTAWQDEGSWQAVAEQAGVADLTVFLHCLRGDAARRRLENDIQLAEVLEVTATPTFFYKFGEHVGYAGEDQLVELIESSR